MAIDTADIKKLQRNLNSIRKIAGWTAQDLGERIGVTKQTISNLENFKTDMTLTQYIAIRAVLDYEIDNNKTNEILPQVVHILLDLPDNEISSEEQKKINQAVPTIAAASASGLGLAAMMSISAGLLGGVTGMAGAGIASSSIPWMKKVMDKKKGDAP